MDLNQRASGVLLHITSLPGPHGIGDFGPAAYHFVDWLQSAGQRLWQLLPMTPVPRERITLGVPPGPGAWREVLNTDSAFYGGSNVGNGAGPLAVSGVGSHGRAQSIRITVPPLATVFLVPA